MIWNKENAWISIDIFESFFFTKFVYYNEYNRWFQKYIYLKLLMFLIFKLVCFIKFIYIYSNHYIINIILNENF